MSVNIKATNLTSLVNYPALSFIGGGIAARIDCGTSASLADTTTSDGTYIAWIYPVTASFASGIMGKGTAAGGNRFSMEVNKSAADTSLSIIRDCATADATAFSVASQIKPFLWQCVAATFDSSTKSVKGFWGTQTQPIAEVVYSTGPINGTGSIGNNSTSPQHVGNYGGTTGAFSGSIAFAAKFDRTLTLDQLRAWQQVPSAWIGNIKATGFWRLGTSGVSTQTDESKNRNTGTIIGASLSAGPSMISF